MRDPVKFRSVVIFIVLVFSLVVLGTGQTRVDNPGCPTAKKAGRIVKLEEVLRIRDDGETDDGFLFVPNQEEDGLVSIGEHRIVDADLFPAQTAYKRIPTAGRNQNKQFLGRTPAKGR